MKFINCFNFNSLEKKRLKVFTMKIGYATVIKTLLNDQFLFTDKVLDVQKLNLKSRFHVTEHDGSELISCISKCFAVIAIAVTLFLHYSLLQNSIVSSSVSRFDKEVCFCW